MTINYETDVRPAMQAYRKGLSGVPHAYIRYHQELAQQAIHELKARGYTIHREYMSNDGWFDGMVVLHLIVESPGRKLSKLRWLDTNQTGYWHEFSQTCGGSFLFKPE
jgi:hypothetical protein